MQETSAEMTAQWQAERDKLAGARDMKEQLDRARADLDIAKREGNLAKAGELSYGVIPSWKSSWPRPKSRRRRDGRRGRASRADRQVVERWTGIPVPRCWKASATSCCGWKTSWASA